LGAGLLLLLLPTAVPSSADAQSSRPDLDGMWSDPPPTPVDQFCFITCTDVGIAHLNRLLDDPANDARPFRELMSEADRYQNEEYIRPLLTPDTAQAFPLDPAEDPGLLRCEPWGFARQIFAPHQMDIRQFDDRIEIRYAEWDARRTIFTDGRRPPASTTTPMGYSVGHWEGDTLVVETTAVTANLVGVFPSWFAHSDRLSAVERYNRSADGSRLEMTVTMEDRESLRQPVHFRKAWGWAPEEEIFPYVDCERPSEVRKGVNQP